ncbi:hypothetical protein HHI36_000954 [Cryptolaemus montrouzieri]|uniref:PiggyBac transposable element-derived protein domain-containing protein n=1 Tax=Cryptolaemus montrouzieri TaxID=559131 RepID=A0ABD2P676_9CUCU
MSRSYEEIKHLQMSDEDIDVADPYTDCNTSDEYEPSESESSNDDYKVLPKKAKGLKKSEINESTQDDQPVVSNCAKSSNGSDDQPAHTADTNIQRTIESIISNFTMESDESEQEDDENSVSNLNWDTVDGSKLKKFDFEVEEVGMKTEYYAEYNKEPYFFFKLFVTDEIIVYIVEQTNIYAQQKLVQQPMNPKAKSKPWFPTDCGEMERLFEIMIWMVLQENPSIARLLE